MAPQRSIQADGRNVHKQTQSRLSWESKSVRTRGAGQTFHSFELKFEDSRRRRRAVFKINSVTAWKERNGDVQEEAQESVSVCCSSREFGQSLDFSVVSFFLSLIPSATERRPVWSKSTVQLACNRDGLLDDSVRRRSRLSFNKSPTKWINHDPPVKIEVKWRFFEEKEYFLAGSKATFLIKIPAKSHHVGTCRSEPSDRVSDRPKKWNFHVWLSFVTVWL